MPLPSSYVGYVTKVGTYRKGSEEGLAMTPHYCEQTKAGNYLFFFSFLFSTPATPPLLPSMLGLNPGPVHAGQAKHLTAELHHVCVLFFLN